MAKMYRVYSVIARPKQEDFWLNLGAAYPHEDGKGFNLRRRGASKRRKRGGK